ncbi:MAG: hypothetical protein LBP61_06000, partial [Desulfovibrio sp.]|nr:hypothetical protein [Desulfovibrio sp.]
MKRSVPPQSGQGEWYSPPFRLLTRLILLGSTCSLRSDNRMSVISILPCSHAFFKQTKKITLCILNLFFAFGGLGVFAFIFPLKGNCQIKSRLPQLSVSVYGFLDTFYQSRSL